MLTPLTLLYPRAQVMDMHLGILAKSHLETKFVKVIKLPTFPLNSSIVGAKRLSCAYIK